MAEVFDVVEDELPGGAIEGADDWLHGEFPEQVEAGIIGA